MAVPIDRLPRAPIAVSSDSPLHRGAARLVLPARDRLRLEPLRIIGRFLRALEIGEQGTEIVRGGTFAIVRGSKCAQCVAPGRPYFRRGLFVVDRGDSG